MKLKTDSQKPHSGNAFGWMGLLMTLGIVYGDIGTSPLYVMKTIVRDSTNMDVSYITGVLSCIIWTLTIQTTVKYVLIALRADNKGEGGILSLYTLVRRLRFKWIYLVAIIGASTLIADGIITPSMTVVSAIEGLRSLNADTPVVPISITIIAALFFVQQFGTKFIGRSFGPVMLLWFLTIGVLGLVHLVDYPAILWAFNPYYALNLLVHSPEWFLIMGAVFLCTTGAEALYADLGHCGIHNIRVSWVFVKTMLILNYLGQGAWMVTHPDAVVPGVNPFFAIMPAWFLPFGILPSHRDNLIMNLSSIIRQMGTTDVKALGLDTSNVTTESVPLIIRTSGISRRIVKRPDDNPEDNSDVAVG